MIEPRHIRPAIDSLVKKLESNLEELERTLEPSWPKLVEPFEKIQDRWTVVWGMIDFLETVRDTTELRAAIEEVQVTSFAWSEILEMTLGDEKGRS
ncbi:hypothetical protein ACJRO7_016874 [Eucalyptus globulus]|uniref:Oligopeptidase A N-terminal domain-containing protein n=1 Tax=Eucalyptus globulus TaxID=34317 RepID=A0ABD3KVG3_EUCGL